MLETQNVSTAVGYWTVFALVAVLCLDQSSVCTCPLSIQCTRFGLSANGGGTIVYWITVAFFFVSFRLPSLRFKKEREKGVISSV